MNVLLVEDEVEFRECLEAVLVGLGFCVYQATNGYEALELLKSMDSGYFDIICTDFNMPFMDGGNLIQEAFQKNLITKVVILISGRNTDEPGIKEILTQELGCLIYFMEKPFSLESFEHSIENAREIIKSQINLRNK